jgi:hypothetical protein
VNQLEQAEEWIEDGEQAVARGDFETAKSLFVEACDTYMELVRWTRGLFLPRFLYIVFLLHSHASRFTFDRRLWHQTVQSAIAYHSRSWTC